MENRCLEKLELESFFLEELSDIEMVEAKKHIESCLVCENKLKELTKEREAFLNELPFEETILNKNKEFSTKKSNILSFTFLKIAAVLLIFITPILFISRSERSDGYRIKGETDIRILVKDSSGEILERESMEFHPNEHIQFLYSCAEFNNFILCSIDNKGVISIYFPATNDSSITLEKGASLPLDKSIMLDNYIGKEIYFALFSKTKLSIANIKEELKINFNKNTNLKSLKFANQDNRVVKKIITIKKEK